MKRLMLGACALLFGSLALSAQGASVPLTVELPDQPTAGARLFVQKSCVRCHALGSREPRVGPDLGRIMFAGSVLDLAGAFWNHAPVMREKMADLKIQPPAMTPAEMADLVAFLTAYRFYLTQLGGPGSPATGRAVFAAKGCSACHGEGPGTFERIGPDLTRYRGRFSAILLAQAMWNHGPEMATAMRGRGVGWPMFRDREMGDLLAYLQAGNTGAASERVYFEPGSPRRGRALFQSKGCVRCHAIAGSGGRGAPDLGRQPRDLVGSVSSIAGLMWNHSRGMSAEFQRRGVARVTFSGQEMADIIAYLFFVNYATVHGTPAAGEKAFSRKCAICHDLSGGASVGPDLTLARGLDEPIAIMAAMWNHSPRMEQELRNRGLGWPRFDRGEAADVTAFLLQRRAPARASSSRSVPARR